MKYRLNKLPVKTTNGFKINDVELDLELPSFKNSHDFDIKGDTSQIKIDKKVINESLNSKIGLELDGYQDIEITIPKGVIVEKPIFINYDFLKDDVLMSNLVINYEENSSCDFVINLCSKDDNIHFSHLKEIVTSNSNSKGNITIINFLNKSSYSFYALENDVLENATITHNIIDLGGKTRLYNAFSNLLGKYSCNNLNTLYIGKNDELLDFNYYLKNIGEDSNNQMKVEGVLTDNSHKNFRGTIDFIKGCCNSIGEENENCILLTDTCRSRSLPQLLCEEENVQGAHGVSSGKVSEDRLFYLMSRGYSKKDAERLIVLGNFNSILNNIPVDDVKNIILDKIEKEL